MELILELNLELIIHTDSARRHRARTNSKSHLWRTGSLSFHVGIKTFSRDRSIFQDMELTDVSLKAKLIVPTALPVTALTWVRSVLGLISFPRKKGSRFFFFWCICSAPPFFFFLARELALRIENTCRIYRSLVSYLS